MDKSRKVEVDLSDYSFLEANTGYSGALLRPIDTARLLKRCFWFEFELSRMTMGWVPAVPDWQIKGELVRMSYLHTQHMKHLRERISELPGPDIGDKSWTPPALHEACQRLSMAGAFPEFAASYRFLVQKLYGQYDSLRDAMDPILDAPTFDRLNYIEVDRQQLVAWALPHLKFAYVDAPREREAFQQWLSYAEKVWDVLDAAKTDADLEWPDHPVAAPAGPVPEKPAADPKYPLVDLSRYKSAMFDPKSPTFDSVKHMVFINASEMSAVESLAYLYYGVRKMPIDFYMDVCRHTWDEVRHSQMGVRRLLQMGYRTEDFSWHPPTVPTPENMKQVFPEFYSSLTMVMEPCSFIKKRKSIDAFMRHGDPLSSIQSEYDIADERLHVHFGQKWGAKLFEHMDDFVTAQSVAEKAKRMHLKKMGYTQEEIDKVLGSFPEFCGFATMDLNYDRY